MRDRTLRGDWLVSDLLRGFGPVSRVLINCQSERGRGLAPWEQPGSGAVEFVDTEKIISALSLHYRLRQDPFRCIISRRPTMRRFLFMLYLRTEMRLDYCITIGDDVVLLESVPELVRLSTSQTPFMVPEFPYTGGPGPDASTEPEVCRFLATHGFNSRYRQSIPDCGYNPELMGFDLSVLDGFDGPSLVELFNLNLYWMDQALLCWLNSCSSKDVKLFGDGEHYRLLRYDDRRYPRMSRVYHPSSMSHKSVCYMLYAYRRTGCWPLWWALIKALYLLPDLKGRLAGWLVRNGWLRDQGCKMHK
jgi:hypothetical protein